MALDPLAEDQFREPREDFDCEETIKKSRFVARVRLARSEEEARSRLKELQQEYKNATHNCWAYRVGFPRIKEYFSDDGEPAGTAGKPILGSILRQECTNTLVVVTRYYGGTKLGVRGLIEAYGGTASRALDTVGMRIRQMARQAVLEVRYDMHPKALHQLKELQVREEHIVQEFGAAVVMRFPVPLSLADQAERFFDGWHAQGGVLRWAWEE